MSLGDSFDEVLAAARGGEEWALRAIYEEFAPRIRGYLHGQGVADPDDLLGAIFLQVVGDLQSFEGSESEFRAWVLAIAHQRLVEDGRGPERHLRPVPTQSAAKSGGEADVEAVAAHEQAGEAMLAELSPDERSVVLLRAVGELTFEQVADVLDKETGEVQQLQHGGLAALTRRDETPAGAGRDLGSPQEESELVRDPELTERSARQLTWLMDSLAERARVLQRESESMVRALEETIARIREVVSAPLSPRSPTEPRPRGVPAPSPAPEAGARPPASVESAERGAAENVRRRRATLPMGAGHEEALLRATQMAIGGRGRAEIEAALRGEFGVARPEEIVDLILGPAGR
ncbi:MAG TPA: sigma-70 family RNA polymerase sigma factor [Solirubrobacterales bacterium]|jgi:RNA polymerase sigma-70 factor (ECF subfamily)|nr:sigma-70 family RNA polymerase sigma factor [Solirubrobacterales bacterium]